MFCNHCGQPVPDGSGFCQSCGAVLGQSPRREIQAPRLQGQTSQAGGWPSRQERPYRQAGHLPRSHRPQVAQRQLWIERDDGLGSIMRHFHAQDHARWKTIAIGAAIVCGLSLLLPWYAFTFLGFDFLDFLNIFGDGVRSPDWLIIAIACVAVIATLYLGHPMWSLAACVFLCYFAIANLTSLFYTFGFMHPTLGFVIYVLATVVTTYACLSAGGLEELNLFLPGPAPQAGFTYPDPTDPHIPRGNTPNY